MDFLNWLDVWLFELISSVWPLYWPILCVVVFFTAIERFWPLESGQPWKLLRFNLLWHLLSLITLFVLSSMGWSAFTAWLTQLIPGPLLTLGSGESVMGEFARVFLVIALGDMIAYWTHRWMHANPVLWAIHRFHHCCAVRCGL